MGIIDRRKSINIYTWIDISGWLIGHRKRVLKLARIYTFLKFPFPNIGKDFNLKQKAPPQSFICNGTKFPQKEQLLLGNIIPKSFQLNSPLFINLCFFHYFI